MLNNITLEELTKLEPFSPNSKLSLNISIDPGSTGTRGLAYSRNSELEELPLEDVEESTVYCGEYLEDYDSIKVLNPEVYDSLEMHFMRNQEPMLSCLKGTLAKEMDITTRVSSSKSKVDQQTTLANIHSFIVMELIKYMSLSKCSIPINNPITIRLTIAMPPEDTDKGRMEAVKNQLSGRYTVMLPRLGLQFDYILNLSEIEIISECNAVAMYYGMTSADDSIIDNKENVLIFEGGGRSSSIAIIKAGQLRLKLNINDNEICGTKLKDELNTVISDNLKRKRLSDEAIESALTTGTFRAGVQRVDVTAEVDMAKKKFATKCVQFIMSAIDNAGMSYEDIQRIVFNGRLMNEIPDKSKSLADYITEEYSSVNDVEIYEEIIQKEYPIPVGLTMYRLGLE